MTISKNGTHSHCKSLKNSQITIVDKTTYESAEEFECSKYIENKCFQKGTLQTFAIQSSFVSDIPTS